MNLKQALLRCAIAVSVLLLCAGLILNAALWLKPNLLRVWIDACAVIQGDKALAVADVRSRFPDAALLDPDAACGPDQPEDGIHHIRYRFEEERGEAPAPTTTHTAPPSGWALVTVRLRFDYEPTLTLVALTAGSLLGLMTLIAQWLPTRAGDRSRPWPRLGTGVGSALVGVLLGLVALSVLPYAADERSINGMFIESLASHPVALVLFACVLAPLVEERLFRGRLLAAFPDDRRSRIVGLLVTSSVFASLHALTPLLYPVVWTTLFLGSISLGVAYLLTRDWRYPAIQHSAYNLTLVAVGLGTA